MGHWLVPVWCLAVSLCMALWFFPVFLDLFYIMLCALYYGSLCVMPAGFSVILAGVCVWCWLVSLCMWYWLVSLYGAGWSLCVWLCLVALCVLLAGFFVILAGFSVWCWLVSLCVMLAGFSHSGHSQHHVSEERRQRLNELCGGTASQSNIYLNSFHYGDNGHAYDTMSMDSSDSMNTSISACSPDNVSRWGCTV